MKITTRQDLNISLVWMKKKGVKKSVTIDDLAVMVANGFTRVEDRLGNVEDRLGRVEDRLGKVEGEIKEVRENVKATRYAVLDIGDRFVPRREFDHLLIRVGKLEQKSLGRKSR